MGGNNYYVGGAVIVGFIVFAGIWIYALGEWGLLFGLLFGWIPALIGGFVIGFLWPLALLAVIAILLLAS